MKKTCIPSLALVCLLILSGCGHSHTWADATCISTKYCTKCGATQGDVLGHLWQKATCTSPKTCERCGETTGFALGHSMSDATCTEPRTCSVCGVTEGSALGHDTPDLTCTTGAACLRCGSYFEAPGHDFAEATCTEPSKCRVCGETRGEALGHTSDTGVCSRCGMESYSTVTGHCDDVVSGIEVGELIYRVHITHSGQRYFSVASYDADNDRDLLVNDIGAYDGYALLSGRSPFSFEITADGDWTYTIEPLTMTSDTEFSGKGDYVTHICKLSSGAYHITHDGERYFSVWIYTSEGGDLLANEIGAYDGKRMVTVPADGKAFMVITADGNWSIKKS